MKHSKIFFGILLILIAVGIILHALIPTLEIFTLPIWKVVIGIVLAYWIIDNLIFHKSIAKKLDIFFPIGLLFILFQNELRTLTGNERIYDIKWWTVLIVCGILTVAINLIFGSSSNKKENDKDDDYYEIEATEKTENSENTEKSSNSSSKSNEYSYSFGSATCYVDATKPYNKVKNLFGSTHIYFNNIDLSSTETIELAIDNAFGQTVIHTPSSWSVENRINNSLGDVRIKEFVSSTTKTIVISGSNAFGETLIK